MISLFVEFLFFTVERFSFNQSNQLNFKLTWSTFVGDLYKLSHCWAWISLERLRRWEKLAVTFLLTCFDDGLQERVLEIYWKENEISSRKRIRDKILFDYICKQLLGVSSSGLKSKAGWYGQLKMQPSSNVNIQKFVIHC